MFKMSKFFLILLSLIIPTVNAQNQNNLLVKIGDEQISTKEFKLRYELSPFLNTSFDEDSIKYHFLLSLIAEKLFTIEAKNLGLEQTEKFDFAFKPLEKIYVRDALFNKEIKSKIIIDEQDILKGINKYNTKLKVEIFSSKDSVQIYKIFNELSSGIPFDSLSDVDEKDSAEISFGDIKDESIEDTLYSLFIGENTKHIKTEDSWFLFYLTNRISSISSEDEKSVLSKVDKIIRERRTEKAYYKYMEEVFKDKIIEADKDLFLLLSENIYNILKQNENEVLSSSSKFYLNESDFERLKTELGNETLNKNFFTVDDKPIALKDFLADLLLEGFSIKSLDTNEINFRLSRQVKNFIEKEYLANIGYKQGLQNSPEVKEQLEMWKENYLAQFYKNTFIESARANEDEVYEYFLEYQNKEKIKQVNIVELLTDSLEIIEYVLNQLEKGEDFKILAAKFTKRDWTKNQNGEFGFFPVTMFGEIGRIADNMKIGDIYGPIKVEEGYSIFQLIDIKETEDSIVHSFAEVKDRMANSLFYEKMNDILIRKTIELANKYKIGIDEGALNSLDVLKIKMFTQRLMGFGGRISAVPFTSPWYEWIYQMEIPVIP
jgi:parvulin-like peptidyl-prolyl isomerase